MDQLLFWLKTKMWKVPIFIILITIPINLLFFSNCSKMGFIQSIEQSSTKETILSCSSNSARECSNAFGTGLQFCSDNNYGECQINNCFPEFTWNNTSKTCDPKKCTPGSEISCTVYDSSGTLILGTGSKKCLADGTYPSQCVPNSCVSGYILTSDKKCVSGSCTNGATKPCSTALGTGIQKCEGNQWSTTCNLSQCNDPLSYMLVGGVCLPKTSKVCDPGTKMDCVPEVSTNGNTGQRTCNADGSAYGSCIVTSCKVGYKLDNGLCITSCTPGSKKSCPISHGTGSSTCSLDGSSWSDCTVVSCETNYVPNDTNTSCLDNNTPTCNLKFDPNPVLSGGSSLATVSGSHIFALASNSLTCSPKYGTRYALSWLLENVLNTTTCEAKVYNEAGLQSTTCSDVLDLGLNHRFRVNFSASGSPTNYSSQLDMDFNLDDINSDVHIFVVALKSAGNNIESMGPGWCYMKDTSGSFKWKEIDVNKDNIVTENEFAACSYSGAIKPSTLLGKYISAKLYDLSGLDIAALGNYTVYAGYGKGTDSLTAFKEAIQYSDANNPYGRYLTANTIPYQGHSISLSGPGGGPTGPLTDYELEAHIYVRSESYGKKGYYFAMATSPDGKQNYFAYKDTAGKIQWQLLPGGPGDLGNVIGGHDSYLIAAPELKNQTFLISDGTSTIKTDWSSLAGYRVYFGYGVGSTPALAAQDMIANKLSNVDNPHILQDSVPGTPSPTGNGDFELKGSISGTSLAQAEIAISFKIDSAHLSQYGAYFLVALYNGNYYCFQSNSTFVLCDMSKPKSLSGDSVIKLDPDGLQNTLVQKIVMGDLIPFGGGKLYLGYGVGATINEAFNEMIAYKSSTFVGRWNEIVNLGFSPDVLRVSGPSGGPLSTNIRSVNLFAFIQPEFLLDTSHRYYGQSGYRFILVQHKGKNFFRVKDRPTPFEELIGTSYTGKSFDGRVNLTYLNQSIYSGDATGFAGASLFVGYGLGSDETAAANWALSNGKVSPAITLPLAPATINSLQFGLTGNESNTSVPLNGSSTIKFEALDAKAASFQCLEGSSWMEKKSWDLSSVINGIQTYTLSPVTKSLSCKLVVTGMDNSKIEKTGLNISLAAAPAPTINSFTASKTNVNAGERMNFNWTTTNATIIKSSINGGAENDITSYGVASGSFNDAELFETSTISIKAYNSSGTASTPQSVSVTVSGTVCNIEAFSGASCRFSNIAGTGVTKDNKNAWYKAVCLYMSKYYRCDGGTNWTEVTGY